MTVPYNYGGIARNLLVFNDDADAARALARRIGNAGDNPLDLSKLRTELLSIKKVSIDRDTKSTIDGLIARIDNPDKFPEFTDYIEKVKAAASFAKETQVKAIAAKDAEHALKMQALTPFQRQLSDAAYKLGYTIKFETTKEDWAKFGYKAKHPWAFVNTREVDDKIIHMDGKMFASLENYNKVVGPEIAAGMPRGYYKNPFGVVLHEITHTQLRVEFRKRNVQFSVFKSRAVLEDPLIADMVKKVTDKIGVAGIKSQLGNYAITAPTEFVAELRAAYYTGWPLGPDLIELNNKIDDYIAKTLGQDKFVSEAKATVAQFDPSPPKSVPAVEATPAIPADVVKAANAVKLAKTLPAAQTANEQLYNALVRHQTYLMRYSGQVRNDMVAILNKTEDEIARLIRDKLATSEGLRTPAELQRMQALITRIQAIRGDAWDSAKAYWETESKALANSEATAMQMIVNTTCPVVLDTVLPSSNMLNAIATSKPFQGRILSEWADTMEAGDLQRISAAIQTGMTAGESSADIARRVVGTGALDGADGATQMTRNQVQAITRTAVNAIANDARTTFLEENSDIAEKEQYVATLDSRTTLICAELDGQVFDIGKGPQPPQHYNCRSVRIMAYDGERLGDRPANSSTEEDLVSEYADENDLGADITTRDDLPYGTKGDYDAWAKDKVKELIGPIPASTNYNTWFSSQTEHFQDNLLGKTKGKLYRDGGLSFDKFIAPNGSEMTLAQLAETEKQAFIAAGLNPADYR